MTDAARIVVVLINENIVGFIVDEVVEVTTMSKGNVEAATSLSSGISAEYFSGIAKAENRLFILLNPETIVNIAQA